MVVENYVADGPYQADEYPLINLFTPGWGLRDGRPEATYYPVPWLLSTAGYGVLADDPQTSYFRLGTDDPGSWSVEVGRRARGRGRTRRRPPSLGPVRLRFFAGPKPADALRRFTEATGRQPKPAAPVAARPLVSGRRRRGGRGGTAAGSRRAALGRCRPTPITCPCGDQVGNEAAEAERIDGAHAAGVAITTYFNPMICTDYQPAYGEAAAAGALTERRGRRAVPVPLRRRRQPGLPRQPSSTSSPRPARGSYGRLLDEAVADGYDGWMEDFGEYTPLDSVSDPGGGAAARAPTRTTSTRPATTAPPT